MLLTAAQNQGVLDMQRRWERWALCPNCGSDSVFTLTPAVKAAHENVERAKQRGDQHRQDTAAFISEMREARAQVEAARATFSEEMAKLDRMRAQGDLSQTAYDELASSARDRLAKVEATAPPERPSDLLAMAPKMERSAPAAAWYANPDGSPSLRYWDGKAWTEHVTWPTR